MNTHPALPSGRRALRIEILERRDLLAVDVNLIRNINETPISRGPNPTQFVEAGGYTYFVGGYQTMDSGLWRTDGTPEGTIRLKEAYAGIQEPTNVNGVLYFQAFEGLGRVLWRSDGTPEGTRVVEQNAGAYASSPRSLINFNGTLFFFANDGVHGEELWKSDGTAEGTTLVKDFVPGSNSSYGQQLGQVGGKLALATSAVFHERTLWLSDGTAEGTRPITTVTGLNISETAVAGNRLFYTSPNGGLWVNNGVGESVYLLDGRQSNVGNLTNHSDVLYFTRDFGYPTEAELWKSDGTLSGTVKVDSDILHYRNDGPVMAQIGATLLYVKDRSENSPAQLWKVDAVTHQQTLVKIFDQTENYSIPYNFQNVGGKVYFRFRTASFGEELWSSDGTELGTIQVKDIRPGLQGSSEEGQRSIGRIGSKAIFSANDGVHGPELWISDGSEGGTILLKDLVSGTYGSRSGYLTEVSGTLYFMASDGVHGRELWKSDGTPGGTSMVKDIRPGASESLPRGLTNVNGTLFFVANDGVTGYELWKSDGTAAGTLLVRNIHATGSGFDQPSDAFLSDWWTNENRNLLLNNVGGILYFRANDGMSGFELWRSDGTPEGTYLEKDILPGSAGSYPEWPVGLNGSLYFSANDGVSGREIWRRDIYGEFSTADLSPGLSGSNPIELISIDNSLYFTAHVTENSLWRIDDGSNEVHSILHFSTISPTNTSLASSFLTNVAGMLYFVTYAKSNYAYRVWRISLDSLTPELVHDVQPEDRYPVSPVQLTNVNGELFFVGRDSDNTEKLWRISNDNSIAVPVATAQRFGEMSLIGDRLYITANLGVDGIEIYEAALDYKRAMQGDIDRNRQIDGHDFLAWQRAFGSSDANANVDGSGTVDKHDLALWLRDFGEHLPMPGDFNRSGFVDGADFLQWQRTFGSDHFDSDGDDDGVVGLSDLQMWRDNFGLAGNTLSQTGSVAAITADEEMASDRRSMAVVSQTSLEETAHMHERVRDAIFAVGDFSRLFGLGGEGEFETSLRRRGRAPLARRG